MKVRNGLSAQFRPNNSRTGDRTVIQIQENGINKIQNKEGLPGEFTNNKAASPGDFKGLKDYKI